MLTYEERKKLQQLIEALRKKEISLNIGCYPNPDYPTLLCYVVSLTSAEGNSVYHCAAQGNGNSIEEAMLDLLEKQSGIFRFESAIDFSKYTVDLSEVYFYSV